MEDVRWVNEAEVPHNENIIRIARINASVARIFFTDKDGSQIPIPKGYELVNQLEEERITPHNNEFLIAWFDSYNLRFEETHVFSIIQKRRQNICNIYRDQ